MFLCVMLLLAPERAPKAGPATCSLFVYLFICLFWANFLISGRRHVIVARVTIEFAAGVNLKTHYQTHCNECAKRFCGRSES